MLFSIIAYARSGALDHAWRLFREAGLESAHGDPAVLSVRGRLLKDRALSATGDDRRRYYREAAQVYARAASLNGATYPLINAATLSLLAGEAAASRDLARQVMDRIGAGDDGEDTPYYHAATRAEALLLLGETAAARAALTEAVALAPRAWEDHASTLRQFALVLGALGEDAGWLDALRPPRAVHFAGHMAVAPEDEAVAEAVRALLEDERVGFGYGALAAGADIIIAEALLVRGAELHLVLPADLEAFRETSVASIGADWSARFDAVVEQADSVVTMPSSTDAAHALDVRLAAEVAMGQAVMQAQRLTTEAIQLLILDGQPVEDAALAGSALFGAGWRATGRRQRVLTVPRSGATIAASPASTDDLLVAVLSIELPEAGDVDTLAGEILPVLAAAMGADGDRPTPPRWAGVSLTAAFATPAQAAAAALAATSALGARTEIRVGGHYGVARRMADPFGGPPLLIGSTTTLPARLTASTPPGAVHVTDSFAAALHAGPGSGLRTEYIGDLGSDDPEQAMQLYSLKP